MALNLFLQTMYNIQFFLFTPTRKKKKIKKIHLSLKKKDEWYYALNTLFLDICLNVF
jgi:hypothetical protein